MQHTKVFFVHRGTRHGHTALIDWESHNICEFTPAADTYFALANWLLDAKPLLAPGDSITVEGERPEEESNHGYGYQYQAQH